MGKVKQYNKPGLDKLRRDARINELEMSIQKKSMQLDAMQRQLDKGEIKEVEIIEEHVKIKDSDDVQILLYVKGIPEGVILLEKELEAGTVTMMDGYRELAGMIDSRLGIEHHNRKLQKLIDDNKLPGDLKDKAKAVIAMNTKILEVEQVSDAEMQQIIGYVQELAVHEKALEAGLDPNLVIGELFDTTPPEVDLENIPPATDVTQ